MKSSWRVMRTVKMKNIKFKCQVAITGSATQNNVVTSDNT